MTETQLEKETILNFHRYVLKHDIKSIEEVDRYYTDHATKENQSILMKQCMFEKAGISTQNKEYDRSNDYYHQIIDEGLVVDYDSIKMVKLFMCDNYIAQGNREAALELISKYTQDSSIYYTIDFLLCYAKITDHDTINDMHMEALQKSIKLLDYSGDTPTSYSELVRILEERRFKTK